MGAARILGLPVACVCVLAAGLQPTNEPHSALLTKMGVEDAISMASAARVVVTEVAVASFIEERELGGWVEPKATQLVRTARQGIVSARLVDDGQTVGAGDVLLRLDDREGWARIAQHEALLARDLARHAQSRVDLERVRALRAKGAASEFQVEQAKLEHDLCESDVAVRRTELAIEKLALEQSVIRAAIGGYVGSVTFEEGSMIAPSDELLTITSLDPVFVSIPIADRDYALLRSKAGTGWSAHIRVVHPATGELLASAPINPISEMMDTRTGTVRVRAEIPNSDTELWPGQFVRVVAELGPARQMNVVPPEALISHVGDAAYVVVAREDGVAEIRQVEIHGRSTDRIFIREGIRLGEKVILEGQYAVADGQRISIDHSILAIADAATSRAERP